jgi:hypothetical protein
MRLLSWNIRHGGGTRLGRIAEEVSAYDADVIALTEFRDRPGAALRAALLEHGWPYVDTTKPLGNGNERARRAPPNPSSSAQIVNFNGRLRCRNPNGRPCLMRRNDDVIQSTRFALPRLNHKSA